MNTYRRLAGELSLLVTAIIFGTFGIFAKELSTYFSTFQITFILNAFQTAFFLIWALARKDRITTYAKSKRISFLLFMITSALPLFFFTNSVRLLPIGAVLLIQNAVTLFTSMLIEYFAQKKSPTIHEVSYIIISIISIAIIYLPFTLPSILGILFAVGVGLFNAIANNFRKTLATQYTPQILGLYSSLFGGIMWGCVALLATTSQANYLSMTTGSLTLLLSYALLNVCTTFLLNKGFAIVPLTMGNAILLFEIVVGYTLGKIFFGEVYGIYQIAGSLTLLTTITALRISPYRILQE